MVKKNDLSSLEKRNLLNETGVSLDTLVSWGEHYEEVGLLYDAVDFYEKAGAVDALARLRLKAKETGNVFLFRRICRNTGYEPVRDEWISIANSAKEHGKLTFASQAYQHAGIEDMAEDSAQDTAEK